MAPKSVLITGCSDGGLGAALAIAFKKAGYRVIASARNTSKLSEVKAQGIETVQLDVLSVESVKKSVKEVSDLLDGSLDVLISNAGAGYSMPVLDIDFDALRNLFELNVLSLITVSREFLPLLRKSPNPIIANNTSIAAVVGLPFQGGYNASKAAAAILTYNLRLELEPFGVKVVDLRTGAVKSNFFANVVNTSKVTLPENSIFNPGKEEIEKFMTGASFEGKTMPASEWAAQVVSDLNRKSPPYLVWRGASATLTRYGLLLPLSFFDGMIKQMVGLDVFAKKLKAGSTAKQ